MSISTALADAVASVAVKLRQGQAVVPPPPPLTGIVLSATEIAEIPALRDLAGRLPSQLRLVAVLMSDGCALLVAVPLNAPPPKARWIAEQRRLAG